MAAEAQQHPESVIITKFVVVVADKALAPESQKSEEGFSELLDRVLTFVIALFGAQPLVGSHIDV